MPRSTFPRDRFDDLADGDGRVGAHRAERPRSRGWLIFLWATLATIVLVIVGIFGVLVASGRISTASDPEPTPTVSETTPPAIDTSYSVVVLNGTADEGLAGNLRDQIVALGWSGDIVQTGDSDTTDFAAVARAFGGDGAVVTRLDQFADAMRRSLASDSLFVIDVRVSPSIKTDAYLKLHFGIENQAPSLRKI